MRDECKKNKVSWPKTLKRWFGVKSKAEDFHADDFSSRDGDEEWVNNINEREACNIKKNKRTERSSKKNVNSRNWSRIDLDAGQVTDVNHYRIFAATWNVAGKSPTSSLNLEDWLHTSPPADIYVLGFQEIVPLNAGNVLGTEDNIPAKKWLALIRKTLNSLPGTTGGCQTPSPVPDPVVELDSDFEGSTRPRTSSFFQRRSFQSLSRSMRMTEYGLQVSQPQFERRYSVCDRAMFGNRPSDYDPCSRWGGGGSSDEDNGPDDSPCYSNYSQAPFSGLFSMEERDKPVGNSMYCLVASKQMVGIYLTIWVKSDLRDDVRNMKVSCVGRGLMGYLGNKGSISISMSLHQTSFCFICSHLTSGQKEGDELRRNSDVMEILRKTRFPRVQRTGDENSPQTILEHDRIIWLGDLNYRIALSYRAAKALVEMRNWRALLEKDQLRIEQRRGRAFKGWSEGKIYFPPTYKYSNNSDRYAGDDMHPKEKRRTPAWCDRILWYGRGLHQMSYVRGESRFSDHRPVYSIFIAEVESINRSRIKKTTNGSSRIEVEELLPYSRRYGDVNLY
ncbi:putative endonuclease/exonuclease/phosphatase [Helianthus annuus]|nr:putative endonuclease/exonuclease/phosphatase [Helianthus annuus]KAJ0955413.1 putative endonuclease/exonuclease/phosphatase [Helianthus annuus]